MALLQKDFTRVALNHHDTPTAGFVQNPDWHSTNSTCAAALSNAVGAEQFSSIDASALAIEKLGDAIYANPVLLGYCWQKGWIPLGYESLTQALRLNAVQVERNLMAFEWGRTAALSDQLSLPPIKEYSVQFKPRQTLEQIMHKRVDFLKKYQNARYAKDYQDFVERILKIEQSITTGHSNSSTRLTESVAKYLFKLMAYKDEYEVARLHTEAAFISKLQEQFEPGFQITHYLAPPLLSKHNSQGEPVKRKFGGWIRPIFSALRHLKFLRGSLLDPFGYSQERRTERALIAEYKFCIEALLPKLSSENIDLAVQIASVPEHIRGYGHVKAKHLEQAREKTVTLLEQWRDQHR